MMMTTCSVYMYLIHIGFCHMVASYRPTPHPPITYTHNNSLDQRSWIARLRLGRLLPGRPRRRLRRGQLRSVNGRRETVTFC